MPVMPSAWLPVAGLATKLFSDGVKTVSIGTKLQLGRLQLLEEPLFIFGFLLQRLIPGALIGLLGHHAVTH